MKFKKLDWASTTNRIVYRAEGNMETEYDITHMDALWYVTVYQYRRFVEDTGSFNTMKEARAWAERQDGYLDGI